MKTQSPAFLKGKANAGELQVAALIKGDNAYSPIFTPSLALASIALDLKPGAPSGTATLTAMAGKAVMLPSNPGADPLVITITPGTVTLQ